MEKKKKKKKKSKFQNKNSNKQYFQLPCRIVISTEVFKIRDELQQIRRYFHNNPELSFKEHNTSQNIIEYLKTCGIETQINIAKTGVVGLLKGDYDGPCILLRGDMDALPINEIETEDNRSFISKNQGVMHACGHDAHMAILLGTARILSKLKHLLHGTVKFCFQPAEEEGDGALAMINEGVLENPHVDQVYGLHVWSYEQVGKILAKTGMLMAGCCFFDINILGKGGHGAVPKGTHDAVLASSHLVAQLHHIISRDINAVENGVVTIGKLESGDTFNVIAEKASLQGTIRWFDEEIYQLITSRMHSICKGIEASYNVTIDLKLYSKTKSVINDKQCFQNVVNAVKQVIPNIEHSLPKCEATMISEDFGEYLDKVKGCFFLLGASTYDSSLRHKQISHHKPDFTIDERCLIIGCQLLCTIVLDQFLHDNFNDKNETKQNQQK